MNVSGVDFGSEMWRLIIKQNRFKVAVLLLLALTVSAPLTLIHPVAAQTSEYYNKEFAWDYNGQHWTWNLSIPQDLYDAYKSVPVSTRTRNGPAGYGFCTTTKDAYVQSLAQELNDTANRLGYDSYDKVSFILAFVQSLPYTSDKVTTGYDEYPRFPIETLVDDGGDCEDTSILFATLALILGYGTVYINPPDHYAVGILGNDMHGTYWTYPEGSNNTYYYCETTGDGFTIGQLPIEFQGQNAYIYPIDQSKQYVPDLSLLPTPSPTDSPVEPYPTQQPSPTTVPSPTVAQPSIQPVLPMSFNLITDNPLLFIVIALAIAASFGVTIWSVRRSKHPNALDLASSSNHSHSSDSETEGNKFCIYCGSENKDYAMYCESCGKQIGQQND